MAKVYTGKVTIPGDKIDEYFSIMQKAEEEREPFKQSLLSLCDDFATNLEKKYAEKTVRKHVGIISLFVDFICRYTDVQNILEITKGMVNTQFKKWWKRKVWDSTTENELRIALKKFFIFLAEEKNIVNTTALKALK
jgi:site-specific recombinase XerD